MACGVFHKASKASFWNKAKGVLGRIGRGIKDTAVKVYNTLNQNKDKIAKISNGIADAGVQLANLTNNDKLKTIANYTQDYTRKGNEYLGKGLQIASGIGL